MEDVDPHMLFDFGRESLLDSLEYWPSKVDVIEIYQFERGVEPFINQMTLEEAQLKDWLDLMSRDEVSTGAIGGLRLIFCPTLITAIPPKFPPTAFPHGTIDIFYPTPLPFSRQLFQLIIETFQLPGATPWLFTTNSSHFQKYSLGARGSSSPRTGFTMRRSTLGIVSMNMALAISHDPSSGLTHTILRGCSVAQQAFIQEQLKTWPALASHPLLLPVLLTGYIGQLLRYHTRLLWEYLLEAETESGQTGAPVLGALPRGHRDYGSITNLVLGIVQQGAFLESYTNALILSIKSIHESISYINAVTPDPRKEIIETQSAILTERLEFISHKSSVMLWDIQFFLRRAEAQMTAVYNHIAQKDTRVTQELSKYSTMLAADSREIAAASKRDSSAMKGIALLTMVFLPATFTAAFFAMPLFDFSAASRAPTAKPYFWIYWAVTVPLTISVLAIYQTYLVWIGRKNRAEDKKARGGVPPSIISSSPSELFPDEEPFPESGGLQPTLPIARGFTTLEDHRASTTTTQATSRNIANTQPNTIGGPGLLK